LHVTCVKMYLGMQMIVMAAIICTSDLDMAPLSPVSLTEPTGI
jgi:hypothetical protein